MPAQVSEKRVLGSILLIAAGIWLFVTAKLTSVPVKISETGLFTAVAAFTLLFLGIRLFSRAVHKV
jgi:hypothetical protein